MIVAAKPRVQSRINPRSSNPARRAPAADPPELEPRHVESPLCLPAPVCLYWSRRGQVAAHGKDSRPNEAGNQQIGPSRDHHGRRTRTPAWPMPSLRRRALV